MTERKSILAKLIERLHRDDGFCFIIISGLQGAGKTVYALKIAKHVLGSYEEALKRLFFGGEGLLNFLHSKLARFADALGGRKIEEIPAEELIKLFQESRKIREKVLIIDDAAYWFSKYSFFSDRRMYEKIGKLFQVIRTITTALILTCTSPRELAAFFRNAVDVIYVMVERIDDERSLARIYISKDSPLQKYIKLECEEEFDRHLPDEVYSKHWLERIKNVATFIDSFVNEEKKVDPLMEAVKRYPTLYALKKILAKDPPTSMADLKRKLSKLGIIQEGKLFKIYPLLHKVLKQVIPTITPDDVYRDLVNFFKNELGIDQTVVLRYKDKFSIREEYFNILLQVL